MNGFIDASSMDSISVAEKKQKALEIISLLQSHKNRDSLLGSLEFCDLHEDYRVGFNAFYYGRDTVDAGEYGFLPSTMWNSGLSEETKTIALDLVTAFKECGQCIACVGRARQIDIL